MQHFDTMSHNRFVERLRVLMRKDHADLCEGIDEGELRAFLVESLAVAERYQIRVEADVYEFVVLRMYFGAEWPRRPDYGWMENILKNSDEPADVRLFQLREQLEFRAELESRSTSGS